MDFDSFWGSTRAKLFWAVGAMVALAGVGYLTSGIEDEEESHLSPKKRQPNQSQTFAPPHPPPEGFDWYVNPQFGVGICAPIGWLAREDGFSFTITEKPTEEKSGNLGVTVTFMPKQSPEFVSKFLKSYLTGMEKQGKMIITRWQKKQVNKIFSSHNCLYMDMDLQGLQPDVEDEEKELFMVFVALIVNEATGSVWLCIFEAPKDQFAEAFNKAGQVMLNNMFFNPQT